MTTNYKKPLQTTTKHQYRPQNYQGQPVMTTNYQEPLQTTIKTSNAHELPGTTRNNH